MRRVEDVTDSVHHADPGRCPRNRRRAPARELSRPSSSCGIQERHAADAGGLPKGVEHGDRLHGLRPLFGRDLERQDLWRADLRHPLRRRCHRHAQPTVLVVGSYSSHCPSVAIIFDRSWNRGVLAADWRLTAFWYSVRRSTCSEPAGFIRNRLHWLRVRSLCGCLQRGELRRQLLASMVETGLTVSYGHRGGTEGVSWSAKHKRCFPNGSAFWRSSYREDCFMFDTIKGSTFASMLKDGFAALAGPAGSRTVRPLSIMGHLVFVEDAHRSVTATGSPFAG